MAKNGFGSVLYPRTVANHVFDAVVRQALAEFGDDPEVRIVDEGQTVKLCFRGIVLARFKKGDEENLGRNHPTQAVLDFVSAQSALPGLPPSAAKVEILYEINTIEDEVGQVVVAARDGADLLWYYELGEVDTESGVVSFPQPDSSEDGDSEDAIVVPRKRGDSTSDIEGE